MEREQLPQSPIDTNLEKQTPHVEENDKSQIDNEVVLDDSRERVAKKQNNINNTLNNIDEIRKQLGLPLADEIPPSVEQAQNSIDELNTQKNSVESREYTLVTPLKEETREEYLSRSMKSIVDDYIEGNKDIDNLPRLLKRAYYGRHAHHSMIDFFSNKENSQKLKKELLNLEANDDKKFSDDKNEKTLSILSNGSWGATRDSASGEKQEKIDYYANTNQERDFFSSGRKHDAYAYSSMVFGLPENFATTEEGKEYIHNAIDNKTIFLFGGGDSIKDLLMSEEFKPKKVINFDPFIKDETIEKNKNGIYESSMISASDKKIREMALGNEIPMADEIWATYSVPFYLDSSEEIKELILNMSSVLNEGGNARISPISVQSKEENGENSETRKKALVDSIKKLLDSPDYNVVIFNDTIKIHKIKKETK